MFRLLRVVIALVLVVWLVQRVGIPVSKYLFQHRNDHQIKKAHGHLLEATKQGIDWALEQAQQRLSSMDNPKPASQR